MTFAKILSILLLLVWTPVYADKPFVKNVAGVSITVSNLEQSVDFYTKVLTFEKIGEDEKMGAPYERLLGVFGLRIKTAILRLGGETLELVQYLTPQGRPIPVDSQSQDRWFQHIAVIVSDIDKAFAFLRQHNVTFASTGPQTLPEWNKNAAGIRAFYFKDPDAHILEILQFPKGKGSPKWTKTDNKLFLGIDHTAIVVDDTEKSLAYYRDTLGMKIVGESENYGTEQEHLNNVFGARLRITTLRAEEGIGIELLEYLAPTYGRKFPDDTRSNDLWHWNTILFVNNIKDLDKALIAGHYRFISPGIINLEDKLELMGRDPDGHAVLFIDKHA